MQSGGGDWCGDEAVSDVAALGVMGGAVSGQSRKRRQAEIGQDPRRQQVVARPLCQAAWAASRKKDCYLAAQFKRLAARRGLKRALMAVAHTLLVIGYYILKNSQGYRELGAGYLEQSHKDQLQRYFVKRLQRLGLRVSLDPLSTAA